MKKIIPVEYKVLIKPEIVDSKSDGGIYFPDVTRDREQSSVDRGEIISHGNGFFKTTNGELPGPRPKVGDTVIFNRYAGSLIRIKNKDGVHEEFRLCNDKDICAILTE